MRDIGQLNTGDTSPDLRNKEQSLHELMAHEPDSASEGDDRKGEGTSAA